MPTRHETGLRRNPSTVSNCAQKGFDQSGTGGRGEAAYTFFGLLEYKGVATEDGGDEDLEFHVREVLTNTRPIIGGSRFSQGSSETARSLIVSLTLGHTRTD